MIYLGIEAPGSTESLSDAIPFALEVQRGSETLPLRLPVRGSNPTDPPMLGTTDPNSSGLDFGASARLGSVAGWYPGSGFNPAATDISGGSGSGIRTIEVAVPLSLPPGSGPVRPLPIQSASTVGGLLSAGPEVRGERATPHRTIRIDEFADPLLMAALPIEAEAAEQIDQGDYFASSPMTDSATESAVATQVPADSNPWNPSPGGISRLTGPGGLPMLIAGLRMARGRPVVPPIEDALPIAPDELSARMTDSAPLPPDEPVEPGLDPFRTEPELDPTRPQVLRTALIGAVALAVGLLLPDLATTPPLLRPRPHRTFWLRRLLRS